MTTIGIDPSLNSTGICINTDGNCTYYIVTSHMTKKMKDFKHDRIHYNEYEKCDTNKKLNEYNTVEYNKAKNVYEIVKAIHNIICEHKEAKIYMEGVSYGSTGSAALVDLSGLNFAIRSMLISNGFDFVIVSPSQNKKFATGNGAADKELMIHSWLMIERDFKSITDIKIDDLADAYFLSCFRLEKVD